MLRKTISPIIYFQQLGRLLSYSKRKGYVVVFDLVNNIKNNPYIYELYAEVIERAQELIKIDVENRERYEMILERFKILNVTSGICELFDELKSEVTINALKERRLETAIAILEGKLESTNAEKIQAQIDLFRFNSFINDELYERVSKLNVLIPARKEKKDKLESDKRAKKVYNDLENYYNISEEYLFRKRFEDELKYCEQEKAFTNKTLFVNDLYNRLLNFVEKHHRFPNLRAIKLEEDEISLFYQKIIFNNELEKLGYLKILRTICEEMQQKDLIEKKNNILNKLIEFINNNQGDYPSVNSNNAKEENLYLQVKSVELYFDEEDKSKLEELSIKYKGRRTKILKQYMEFIKQNRRYPLLNSENEEERNMMESFIRYKNSLTPEEKELIKNSFSYKNKKYLLQQSYLAMKNKK